MSPPGLRAPPSAAPSPTRVPPTQQRLAHEHSPQERGENALAAEGVSVRLGGATLLRGVSAAVRPGELLAVIGPNGAGKSTLLKVLCGDLEPNAGTVTLDGAPLRSVPKLEQARRRAVLPQESLLSFPFTAFEVALMGRHPHVRGTESAHDHAVTRAAMAKTHTARLAERRYPTLSGGEKGRVQLARALAQIWEDEIWEGGGASNRYLLLDEPTNNLDLAHQHTALSLAQRFAAQGAGVLAVLHDLNLAAQYATRVLLLRAGEVVAYGTPTEVLTETTLQSTFETPVRVVDHPCLACPLIVSAVGAAREGS
jgi:iron complex transport system ATP-binding protein